MTQPVGSTVPEASPHDSHPSSINPQAMDPATSHLIPLIQTDSLPFEKVLDPLAILILSITF